MERKARTEQREPSRDHREGTDGGEKVYQVGERKRERGLVLRQPNWQ